MAVKKIEFGDGSHIQFDVREDGRMVVFVQAKHLGKEIKFTSTAAELSQSETVDVVNWIANELTKDE